MVHDIVSYFEEYGTRNSKFAMNPTYTCWTEKLPKPLILLFQISKSRESRMIKFSKYLNPNFMFSSPIAQNVPC